MPACQPIRPPATRPARQPARQPVRPRATLAALAPAYGLAVLRALEAAGHEAWFVGGWVRDALRGVPAHDVDVCTSACWQDSERALVAAGMVVHETGTEHGTVTAVSGGRPVEVTTYRVDGAYSDRRHPDSVTFVGDVRADLARRDFTVNAMAWHPDRGLLDPFGGRADLSRGLIRAVGEPTLRFEEDALRVLRAVRFACRLGFAIEPATQVALVASASELASVARERVGAELRGIVGSGRGGWALLHERDVMVAAIPELASLAGLDQRSVWHSYDVLEHTARVMAGVECFTGGVASERLRWAALLHDIGKPACLTVDGRGQGHFYGHPDVGADIAEKILRDLAIPGELARQVVALVRYHDRPMSADAGSELALIAKLDRASGLKTREEVVALMHEMLDLRRADAVAKAPRCRGYAVELGSHERVLRGIAASRACWRVADLAVGGVDVMEALGIAAGPAVGRALRGALSAVMAGKVANERDELVAWLRAGGETGAPRR